MVIGMQHFFTEPGNINGDTIYIEGEDVNHIKNVLRMREGEVISVSNGIDDNEYRAEIADISDDRITCKLMFIKRDGIELPVKITLFQGLPKADKMELIIQKAVELGVSEIVPVETKRAVVKLDAKKAESKVKRWNMISEAAAKQSKRGIIPTVTGVMTFKEAVNEASKYACKSIPYELAEGMTDTYKWIQSVIDEAKKNNAEKKSEIAIFIGPEGGFDNEEIEIALRCGIVPISLGKRILRTETAGMTILSILMYELEVAQEKDISLS